MVMVKVKVKAAGPEDTSPIAKDTCRRSAVIDREFLVLLNSLLILIAKLVA
jgi:hypothetical protein